MEEEYLYLGLGQLEIDWSKGSFQKDHTILFKTGDRKDISYFYYNEDEPKKFSTKKAPGYGKKLIEVKDRLDLLGYSFKNLPKLLREQFEHLPYEIPEIRNLSVEKFISTLSTIEVSGIRFGEHEGDAGLGEFFQRRILSLPAFAPIGKLIQKIRSFDYYLFEQIDPYIILAALANNPKNQKIELCLRSDAAITPPTKQQRYLVVTEGKTDVAVIQKAMEILKPNIADLFEYMDMEENYPFGGAGNLCNFFKGLTKIGTERRIIFIFDNDAQGQAGLITIGKVSSPSNFISIAYPSLPEFSKFNTTGPTGQTDQDINGRAVAVEMFLDLTYKTQSIPIVQWSSFISTTGTYQGALLNKENYQKIFTELKVPDFKNYDFKKLNLMLDHIISEIIK